MSAGKRSGIRSLYTPTERALLAAYLGYPDPAPAELVGIDITQPVDPDDWDAAASGIAPILSLYKSDALMLENAVARICLTAIDAKLPQWASLSRGRVTLGRKPARADRTRRHPRPVHLFTINWADSGPGFSWPEAYYVTSLPGYDVCIVTASADCPEVHGYCDVAIGWFVGDPSNIKGAGECIRSWWSWSCAENNQGRWAYLFDTAAVDGRTAAHWADEVWGEKRGIDEDLELAEEDL